MIKMIKTNRKSNDALKGEYFKIDIKTIKLAQNP